MLQQQSQFSLDTRQRRMDSNVWLHRLTSQLTAGIWSEMSHVISVRKTGIAPTIAVERLAEASHSVRYRRRVPMGRSVRSGDGRSDCQSSSRIHGENGRRHLLDNRPDWPRGMRPRVVAGTHRSSSRGVDRAPKNIHNSSCVRVCMAERERILPAVGKPNHRGLKGIARGNLVPADREISVRNRGAPVQIPETHQPERGGEPGICTAYDPPVVRGDSPGSCRRGHRS